MTKATKIVNTARAQWRTCGIHEANPIATLTQCGGKKPGKLPPLASRCQVYLNGFILGG